MKTFKLEKVYHVKTGRRFASYRLRCRINGYAYKCGNAIRDSDFAIQRVDSKGIVVLKNWRTDQEITLTTTNLELNNDY